MEPERYDKIQLLPFGEFVPFRESIACLYELLLSLGPPNMRDYELRTGAPGAWTVFHLNRVPSSDSVNGGPAVATQAWRFVVPICFEDIVAPLVDDLMWGANGKRADFIVNITNYGWFGGIERAQHLQDAVFRSIEHQVPTARSVNTGISGFIDSTGRMNDTIAAGTEGDAFAKLCAGVTVFVVGYGMLYAMKNR